MQNTQLEHSDHSPSGQYYPLCFLAHDMDIPSNVGSLFRLADALGVERIYLSGNSIKPPNAKLSKTARSSDKYVAHEYFENPLDVINHLKQQDYTIVALELTHSSIDLKSLQLEKDRKVCLILGAENQGVSQSLLDAADTVVHIPMMGQNSSMNVATACAIATYELCGKLLAYSK